MSEQSPTMRLDKWLWAARFFKTRALAHAAIDAGHVRLNGERPKPARDLKPGDRLRIRQGEEDWDITVMGLSSQRGPAPAARALYEESPASAKEREQRREERRLAADPGRSIEGKPSKKDRRLIHRFLEPG